MRKKILEQLFHLKGGKVMDYLRDQQETFLLPRKEILNIQEERLQELLLHAYKNVPYYRDLFDEMSLVKDDVFDLARFSEIPPLTKDVIRSEGVRMHSENIDIFDWYENSSGGSTGEPITILLDERYKNSSWAHKILYNQMLGKDLGDKEVKLWGSERDIFKGSIGFKAHVENYVYNRMLLNSFKMSEEDMRSYVQKINGFKPVSIWAYVDSMYELARFVEKESIEVFSPRFIMLTAGTVYPEVKEYIEKVFKTNVYNQYGSREVGDMAVESPEKVGLYVFEYLYKFEILDSNLKPVKPGEIGEIYVTPLMNFVMPLLRYKIGDTASWSDFSPGEKTKANLMLINDVHGRTTNHFKKSDGEIIHGEYFTHLFYFKDWIEKFQVVQQSFDVIECFVVKRGEVEDADVKDISNKIYLVMGTDVEVRFTYVDIIEPSKSGKFLYTLSKVI